MRISIFTVSLTIATCFSSAFASTMLLTTDPGTGQTTTFKDVGFTSIPGATVLDGYSVTGTPQVSFGNVEYGLGELAAWSPLGEFSWIGTNDFTSTITFDLDGGKSFVGLFMNYAHPNYGSDATLTAIGIDGKTVLGTYDLETLAPIPGQFPVTYYDYGAFRGIESTSDDIGYLSFGGDYSLAHSIEVGTLSTTVTPEPSTFALLATGVLGSAAAIRRRFTR